MPAGPAWPLPMQPAVPGAVSREWPTTGILPYLSCVPPLPEDNGSSMVSHGDTSPSTVSHRARFRVVYSLNAHGAPARARPCSEGQDPCSGSWGQSVPKTSVSTLLAVSVPYRAGVSCTQQLVRTASLVVQSRTSSVTPQKRLESDIVPLPFQRTLLYK